MALDQDQQQAVLNHLQANLPGGCPACGGQMNITDRLALAPIFENGGVQMGNGFPAVVAVCEDCGNMMFFNAEVVGVNPQNA